MVPLVQVMISVIQMTVMNVVSAVVIIQLSVLQMEYPAFLQINVKQIIVMHAENVVGITPNFAM